MTGNHFQVILREVQGASRLDMEAAAAALKEGGFINYYGLQRFGSGSVPTHRYLRRAGGGDGGGGASRGLLKQGGFISHHGLQWFAAALSPHMGT